MLINTRGGNGFNDVRKHKNEYWEVRNITPNEAVSRDPRYANLLKKFKSHEKITSPNRFFEVRIVKQKPSHLMLHPSTHWWDQPGLMDHVFWVFQQPMFANRPGEEPYGVYILEPFECRRIAKILSDRFHVAPPEYPGCFIVPVELCQLAWTETVNGYSEHIHYREEEKPSDQFVNKAGERKEQYQKMIDDAKSDSRLMRAMTKAVDQAQDKLTKMIDKDGNSDGH